MDNKTRIAVLEGKIRKTEQRGYVSSGCVRKWKREIRNLSK